MPFCFKFSIHLYLQHWLTFHNRVSYSSTLLMLTNIHTVKGENNRDFRNMIQEMFVFISALSALCGL